MMDYQIISAEYPRKLTMDVFEEMMKGWVPQGGICVSKHDVYFQAMIREQKDATPRPPAPKPQEIST